MNSKTTELQRILNATLLLNMEDFNNEDILEVINDLKEQLNLLELQLVDEELAKLETTPEGVIQTVEKWCSYPMNYLSLEGRHLDNGVYEAKIQPNTWDEHYRLYEAREYTPIGKYYLVAYPGSQAQYINNVASFIYHSYTGEAKTINGDIDIISRETYHKIIGD